MPGGQRPLPVGGDDHRRPPALRNLPQLVPGAGPHHAAAGDDQRTLGGTEQRRHLLQRAAVQGRGLDRRRRRERRAGRDGGVQDVRRQLDRGRPRPPGDHVTDSLRDQRRHLLGPHGPTGPLGDRAQQLQLARELVQQAPAAVDLARRHLARHAQHRGGAGVGRREAGHRVEDARAGDHEAAAGTPRRPRVAVGHEGGGLLVARVDHADLAGAPGERVEGRVELHAGQAEDDPQAVRQQGLDQQVGAGGSAFGDHAPIVCGATDARAGVLEAV